MPPIVDLEQNVAAPFLTKREEKNLSIFSNMNCTEIDRAITEVHTTLIDSDWGFALGTGALAAISLLLLVAGGELMRPLSTVVAAVGGGGAVFLLAISFDCQVRLIVSGVAAVVAALLAACLVRSGLFVLGAAGFGAVAHLVYDALPLEGVRGPFVLLGRSGWYYIAMLTAIGLGAVVGWCQKKQFVRITSALAGGGGVALATHLVFHRVDEDLSSVALLAIFAVAATTGIGVQHARSKHKKQRKKKERQQELQGRQERV